MRGCFSACRRRRRRRRLLVCLHRSVKEHLMCRRGVSAPVVCHYTANYWPVMHTTVLVSTQYIVPLSLAKNKRGPSFKGPHSVTPSCFCPSVHRVNSNKTKTSQWHSDVHSQQTAHSGKFDHLLSQSAGEISFKCVA